MTSVEALACRRGRGALSPAVKLSQSHAQTHVPLFSVQGENMQRPGQRDVCRHHVQGGQQWKLHAKQAQPLSSRSTASKKMRKRGRGSDTWH